jgi:hypothetical protein
MTPSQTRALILINLQLFGLRCRERFCFSGWCSLTATLTNESRIRWRDGLTTFGLGPTMLGL